MKKTVSFVISILFLLVQNACAEVDSLVINITEGTRLNTYIDESIMGRIKYLKLSGSLNVHDLDIIYSKMCGYIENKSKTGYMAAGSLKVLDMREVILVDPASPMSSSYVGSLKIPDYFARQGNTLEELYLPKCHVGIESFQNSYDLKIVEIPEGTTIGSNCFRYCHFIDSVNLPNSIDKYIVSSFKGNRMKSYNVKPSNTIFSSLGGALASKDGHILYAVPWGLQKYIIPSSITKIEQSAFRQHPNIETICIGENVTSLAKNCFDQCVSLSRIIVKTVTVPALNSESFNSCKKLITSGKLYVPKGMVSQYSIASGWCRIPNIIEYDESELESILNEKIEEVGDFDFKDNDIYYKVISVPGLTVGVCDGTKEYEGNIDIPSKVTFRNKEFRVVSILRMSGRNLKGVRLPETIESIGLFAETGLVSLIIPNSVKSIQANAFANCEKLEYVKISDNVTKLDRYLFRGCQRLRKIDWDPNGSSATISGRVFLECNSLTSFTIPSNVSKTGNIPSNLGYECSFFSCASLDTLIIQDSDKEIIFGWDNADYLDPYEPSKGEFFLCDIKNLYLGRNYSYSKRVPNLPVRNLTIGDFVTSLKYWPSTTNLVSLTIGKSLTSIPSLLNATNLNKITLRTPIPPTAIDFSNETYMNAILYVPKGCREIYQSAPIWKFFWNIEEYDYSDGIDLIVSEQRNRQFDCYKPDGTKISNPMIGVNILKYKDGTSKKMLIRR